jgi:Fe2+ or Zn2+ uptake regulation protein
MKRPVTLSEIHENCSEIDFASVYRSVKLFSELEIVHEISWGDKVMRYEIMGDDHHHHIVCKVCGKIERLDFCMLEKVKEMTSFEIHSHSFEFVGVCPKCKKQ